MTGRGLAPGRGLGKGRPRAAARFPAGGADRRARLANAARPIARISITIR